MSEAAAAAEKPAAAPAAGGGGNKLLLLIVLVVNILIAGGLAFVVISGQKNSAAHAPKAEGEEGHEAAEGEAAAEESHEASEPEAEGGHAKKGSSKFGPLVEVGTFVANLQSATGATRYAKVALHVEAANEEAKVVIEAAVVPIRNEALVYLSGLQAEQVIGAGKISFLQDELQKRMTAIFGKNIIKRVFFSEFVIQ